MLHGQYSNLTKEKELPIPNYDFMAVRLLCQGPGDPGVQFPVLSFQLSTLSFPVLGRPF